MYLACNWLLITRQWVIDDEDDSRSGRGFLGGGDSGSDRAVRLYPPELLRRLTRQNRH